MMRKIARAALGAVAVAGAGAAAADEGALLARGAYLMNGVVACGNCHTPQGPDGPVPGMELAGGMVFDEGVFVARAPNITPDGATGVGGWSDEDLARAIREGIRPDGSVIGPPMPMELYRHLSDDDLAALVAYLRQVPAVENAVPASTYEIPLPPSYGPPIESVAAPDAGDPVTYGAYLVQIGHCMECHTPIGPDGRRDWSRLGAGGAEFPGPWGVAVSRNLTSHPEDGLGSWSDEEIVAAITTGVRPNGDRLNPPMPYGHYATISEADLAAIVAYLRTLPAQESAM